MKYKAALGLIAATIMIIAGCDINQDIANADSEPESQPNQVSEDIDSGLESQPQEVQDFVRLLNEYREDQGLSALEWHDDVAAAALSHSEDMRDRGYFSHNDPDGGTPWDRLQNHGVSYSTAGENIAGGYQSGEAVLQGWLNSPRHKANIDTGSLTHHGVGYVEEGNLWTHKFAQDPR